MGRTRPALVAGRAGFQCSAAVRPRPSSPAIHPVRRSSRWRVLVQACRLRVRRRAAVDARACCRDGSSSCCCCCGCCGSSGSARYRAGPVTPGPASRSLGARGPGPIRRRQCTARRPPPERWRRPVASRIDRPTDRSIDRSIVAPQRDAGTRAACAARVRRPGPPPGSHPPPSSSPRGRGGPCATTPPTVRPRPWRTCGRGAREGPCSGPRDISRTPRRRPARPGRIAEPRTPTDRHGAGGSWSNVSPHWPLRARSARHAYGRGKP